jgi:hypothetical protein
VKTLAVDVLWAVLTHPAASLTVLAIAVAVCIGCALWPDPKEEQ